MKQYQLNGTIFYCPVDLTLSVIRGRWQGLIIWGLREGPLRFGELKRMLVTVNDKMLSQTLKQLADQGIVSRKPFKETPPRVEYALTARGQELIPIFKLMGEWGEHHNYRSGIPSEK